MTSEHTISNWHLGKYCHDKSQIVSNESALEFKIQWFSSECIWKSAADAVAWSRTVEKVDWLYVYHSMTKRQGEVTTFRWGSRSIRSYFESSTVFLTGLDYWNVWAYSACMVAQSPFFGAGDGEKDSSFLLVSAWWSSAINYTKSKPHMILHRGVFGKIRPDWYHQALSLALNLWKGKCFVGRDAYLTLRTGSIIWHGMHCSLLYTHLVLLA